jgi:tetraether lipid synthase
VTREEQHDLDALGIAKNSREEKLRARAERIKKEEENQRMAKLYREVVLKEQAGPALVQIAPPPAAPAAKPAAESDRELVGSCGD